MMTPTILRASRALAIAAALSLTVTLTACADDGTAPTTSQPTSAATSSPSAAPVADPSGMAAVLATHNIVANWADPAGNIFELLERNEDGWTVETSGLQAGAARIARTAGVNSQFSPNVLTWVYTLPDDVDVDTLAEGLASILTASQAVDVQTETDDNGAMANGTILVQDQETAVALSAYIDDSSVEDEPTFLIINQAMMGAADVEESSLNGLKTFFATDDVNGFHAR